MNKLLLAALLACGAAPALAGGLPAGTPVLTINGSVPVEDVRPGDRVLAYSNEKLLQVEVKDVEKKRTRVLELKTSRGSLKAAPEHPVLTRFDFTEMRALKKGDDVAVFDDGRRVWARVRSVKTAGLADVYNLAVDPPHTFIAGGFVVHNYYSSSYRRRRSYGPFDLVIFGIAAIIVFLKNQFRRTSYGRGGSYNSYGSYGSAGGYGTKGPYNQPSAYRPAAAVVAGRLQDSAIVPRAQATLAILKTLGARDPDFNPDELAAFARKLFAKFKAAQQARDFYAVRGLLMPNILASHSAKAESQRVRGEVNMIEDLKVLDVDFMHVRCPREKEGRSFTVLVSYVAKDYLVRENSNINFRGAAEPASRLQVAGGSLEPQNFQEYWTFNQLSGNWALARIDQPGEMDFINAPNLPDTPQAAASFPMASGAAAIVLGAAAAEPRDHSAYMPPGSPAPARPQPKPAEALPPAAARQPAAEGDHWNRQRMEIAATLAFESIYEAWGKNDSALLTGEYVSAEALVRLKTLIDARRAEGLIFEFKSLFPRRAEIVLTSPAAKSKLHIDEFTARITATAVRAMSRNGRVLHRDEAPEPFTEYWVFGRQDKAWKLRDILPRMDHETDRTQDGAPGPTQIEWYWHS